MASIPLEMDDIFDQYDDVQDFSAARLPDLEDELEPMRAADSQEDVNNYGDGGGDGGDQPITDDPELLAKLASMKGALIPKVKRTIPKLDATRLTGDRGLPILPKVFKNIPLKGKHHEVEDLKNIMRHLEHWGHRLFPKMPFMEVLDRCERLGAKKEVQTCIKKIRMDIPVLSEDHMGMQDDDVQRRGEDDDVQRQGDTFGQRDGGSDDSETEAGHPEIDEEEIEDLLRDQEEFEREHSGSQTSGSKPQPAANSPPTKTELSDEVKARIERNKKLAMERRAAKLAHTGSASSTMSEAPNIPISGAADMQMPEPDRQISEEPRTQLSEPNIQTSEPNTQTSEPDTQMSEAPDTQISGATDTQILQDTDTHNDSQNRSAFSSQPYGQKSGVEANLKEDVDINPMGSE